MSSRVRARWRARGNGVHACLLAHVSVAALLVWYVVWSFWDSVQLQLWGGDFCCEDKW